MFHILLLLLNCNTNKGMKSQYKVRGSNGYRVEKLINIINNERLTDSQKIENIERSISYGANVNERDHSGRTPLLISSRMGNIAIMTKLLDAGANINTADDLFGLTPLHAAVDSKNFHAIDLLVERGADINKLDLISKKTPIDFALENNNISLAIYFLNKGGKLGIKDNDKIKTFSSLFPTLLSLKRRIGRFTITSDLIKNLKEEFVKNRAIIRAINDEEYKEFIKLILEVEKIILMNNDEGRIISLIMYSIDNNIIDLKRSIDGSDVSKFILNNLDPLTEDHKTKIINKIVKVVREIVSKAKRGL